MQQIKMKRTVKADRFFVGRPFKFGVDQQNTKFFAPSAIACIVSVTKNRRITAATSKNCQLEIIKDRKKNLKYTHNTFILL
jgi:hypothetical protein